MHIGDVLGHAKTKRMALLDESARGLVRGGNLFVASGRSIHAQPVAHAFAQNDSRCDGVGANVVAPVTACQRLRKGNDAPLAAV